MNQANLDISVIAIHLPYQQLQKKKIYSILTMKRLHRTIYQLHFIAHVKTMKNLNSNQKVTALKNAMVDTMGMHMEGMDSLVQLTIAY